MKHPNHDTNTLSQIKEIIENQQTCQNNKTKAQQQDGIQIQIQDEENDQEELQDKDQYQISSKNDSSNCIGFASRIVSQLQNLNVSAPDTKMHHNDSIMMQNLSKLENKKQS